MSVMALNPEVDHGQVVAVDLEKGACALQLERHRIIGNERAKEPVPYRHEDQQQPQRKAVARLLDQRETRGGDKTLPG